MWNWINSEYPRLKLAEIIPFSRYDHDALYNIAAVIMVLICIDAVQKLVERKRNRGGATKNTTTIAKRENDVPP